MIDTNEFHSTTNACIEGTRLRDHPTTLSPQWNKVQPKGLNGLFYVPPHVCGAVIIYPEYALGGYYLRQMSAVSHSTFSFAKIGNIYYQFLETLTGRGISQVNYAVPRLSKFYEDTRRSYKDFQQVWYKLELFKVCRNNMPCEVKKNISQLNY